MTSDAGLLAPAKINLTLHLTGLRADGYHLLDSLVVFVDLGDRVSAHNSESLSLTVSGPFAEGVPTDSGNLVLKAARRLQELRGVTSGAALHLEKHLPHGGGIGGGSSDAATTIRLLGDLWQVAPLSAAEALPLGADIPVCLAAPQPMFMRGIGDNLTPARGVPEGWLVLVNPRVAVPTGKVFALHDRLYQAGNPAMTPLPNSGDPAVFQAWLAAQRNDLTNAARHDSIAPVISDVLTALRGRATVAGMSGSGSTCWGWFSAETGARDAAQSLGDAHPDWWVRAARVFS